jgi:hypothetical protein
LFSNTAFYFS